jgi:hypothetical protein
MTAASWRGALCAACLSVMAILPAKAAVVTFEDVAPTLFSGDSIVSGGFRFTSSGTGFSGVDNASAFVFGNAPANADGQFLFMLNNDGIVMSSGSGFLLRGFDASFIAPLGGLGAGILPGQLLVLAQTLTGALLNQAFEFTASDANGDFNFASLVASALDGQVLEAVGFFACVYDAAGACVFDALDVPAQFALDNLRVDIPEPGTLALLALALVAAGAFSRRRAH